MPPNVRSDKIGPESLHAGTAVQQQVFPGEREMVSSIYRLLLR